jgi:hypothetical protein
LVSRFLGWRPPDQKAPFAPLFSWQKRIPQRIENSFLSCIGALCSIIVIEWCVQSTGYGFRLSSHSVMISSDLFHDWGGPPLIVASIGASAVLLFSTFESPLAQPRNALGGQMLSALVGIAVTRLFALSPSFLVTDPPSQAYGYRRLDWLAAALGMSLSLLVMELTGTVHPPGGATALICAITPSAYHLEWRFLLVLFASICLMLCFALIFGNLGRRRCAVPLNVWGERALTRKRAQVPDVLVLARQAGRRERVPRPERPARRRARQDGRAHGGDRRGRARRGRRGRARYARPSTAGDGGRNGVTEAVGMKWTPCKLYMPKAARPAMPSYRAVPPSASPS